MNIIINDILHSIKDKPFLKRPKPLPEHLTKKRLNEYCSFHQWTGQATRNCRTLRDHIEELFNQIYCWEFVKSKARKEKSARGKDHGKFDCHELTNDENDWCLAKKPTLSINCIYGGQRMLKERKVGKPKQKRGAPTTLRWTVLKPHHIG